MERRSMDRKLRSSGQKNRASLTTLSSPKPAKKIRLSATNKTGNHSNDVPNTAHPNESDVLLQSEKSIENRDDSMHLDNSERNSENSNENESELMQSDDLSMSSCSLNFAESENLAS